MGHGLPMGTMSKSGGEGVNETELRLAKEIYERQLVIAESIYTKALSNKHDIEMQLKEIQRRLDEMEVTA